MFFPGQHFSPGGVTPCEVSKTRTFRSARKQFCDDNASDDSILSPISAENCGKISAVAMSPDNSWENCNDRTNANQIGDVVLHGKTGGCAILHDAPLGGRHSSGGAGGNQRGASTSVAYADPGAAPRQQHPSVSYTNHPHYGWLPTATPYLAVLAARVVS